MQEKTHPIYSKLDYEDTLLIKKNILAMQINFLNLMLSIEHYKLLRKKEMLEKIKLKKIFKETKQNFDDIIKSVPQTEGIKLTRKQAKLEGKSPDRAQQKIELELKEIRERLQELG